MAWRFDPISNGLIWYLSVEMIQPVDGSIDLGSGDLSIDTGLRENDSSTLDQGERI